MVVGGEEHWVLDALPAELIEQVFLQQWQKKLEHEAGHHQEWKCSGWRPGALEVQVDTVSWKGELWEQKEAEESFADETEKKLLGEGMDSMRGDEKWRSKLEEATQSGRWGVLDVYSDGGADGAGTPEATAEYGWLIGGTDEQSLKDCRTRGELDSRGHTSDQLG